MKSGRLPKECVELAEDRLREVVPEEEKRKGNPRNGQVMPQGRIALETVVEKMAALIASMPSARPRETPGSRLTVRDLVEKAEKGELNGPALESLLHNARLAVAGGRVKPKIRGTAPQRMEAADKLEAQLLRELDQQRKRGRDLLGRRTGAR